ncbi:MAG: PAS domain S-box protein [Dehalococcoidia bacterium]
MSVLQQRDLPDSLEKHGIKHLARVPVRTIHQEFATIIVELERSAGPTSREQFLLNTLANQAAIALENVRLRREANEQSQTLRGLIQASPLAIIAHDREAKVQIWNPAAEQLFGWTEEEVLGRSYPLVPGDMQDEFRANIDRTLRGEALTGLETRRQKKDGTLIDVGIWTAPYGDGDAIVVIADITERRQAEEAQRELTVIEERHRLARELHDSVTQSLYSATLMAEAGRRLTSSGDFQRVEQTLGLLGETTQQALKEMRLLVYQLRPPELEREGLIGALGQRLDAVERRAGVETRLLFDENMELPTHLEEDLYRVAQEALNNALKHAGATSVTVSVKTDGESVELTVDDNGRGFDSTAASGSGGMGLVSMRERIQLLGGTLDIRSVPGEGTRVKVKVAI